MHGSASFATVEAPSRGGGARKLEAIRATGRGTARERIGMLLDEGSFIELDAFVTHRTTDHSMHLHPLQGTAGGRPRQH